MSLPGPKTILLVEDEPLLLRFVRSVLQRAGYAVLSAATPEAAMAIERDCRGPIELLLTGFSLPRLSGPELAETLEWRRPEMRVMLMSCDPDARSTALACGWSYIGKPFPISTFIDTVESAFAPNADRVNCSRGAVG